MVRNVLGSALAALGAAAAVWSPFHAWYNGRLGRDIRVEDLFTGMTGRSSDLFLSMLLPMAVGALLTLIGILLRSRTTVTLAGIVVLGFTVLWMVRQGQAAGSLTAGGQGLGPGAGLAVGGGVLILLGALVMRGRRRRRQGRHRQDAGPDGYPPEHDPDDEPLSDDFPPYERYPNETPPYGTPPTGADETRPMRPVQRPSDPWNPGNRHSG